jgi:hypothetical protein
LRVILVRQELERGVWKMIPLSAPGEVPELRWTRLVQKRTSGVPGRLLVTLVGVSVQRLVIRGRVVVYVLLKEEAQPL